MWIYFVALVVFFLLINVYFKIADKYNIIDKPNQRSSHTEITIRGGGIVFYFAGLFYFAYSGFQYPIFFMGLTALAFISFLDDMMDLSSKLRLGIHFLAMTALIYELGLFSLPIWLLFICFVVMTGIMNAYNFMDGINGITGFYSLILLSSLVYINRTVVNFVDNDLIYFSILAVLVFNFYNFRKKASCFAGDVGSVSMAFIVLFLLGKLIFQTQNLSYILLLSIYGVDTILTIVHRILKKENILQAHRSHLYQYMVHTGKKTHLLVASLYGVIQFLINAMLIYNIKQGINLWVFSIGVLLLLGFTYIFSKRYYLKISQ